MCYDVQHILCIQKGYLCALTIIIITVSRILDVTFNVMV